MVDTTLRHDERRDVAVHIRASSSRFRQFPLVVTFEGPDGAGKSTLAQALAEWLRDRGVEVRSARSRPKTTEHLRTKVYDHQHPHESRQRGSLESVARVVAKFGFYLLRWPVETARSQAPVVLIRERGWLDYAIDPRRYGLAGTSTAIVMALGRVFPKSDLTVVLAGDPTSIHARKPDLSTEEIGRVIDAWRRHATTTARSTLEIDTTASSPAEALRDLLVWISARDDTRQR